MMSTRRGTYSYSTPRGGSTPRAGGVSALVDKVDKNRLLTDRAAYLNFLEVQLERVSSSCLTVQAFSERIESVQSQVNAMEEKVLNCGRLIKLMQQYNEEVNRVAENIKVRVNEMNEDIENRTNDKIAQTLKRIDTIATDTNECMVKVQKNCEENVGIVREDMEKALNKVEEVEKDSKALEKQVAEQFDMIKASEKLCNRLADDAVGSIEANDRKMTDFFEQFREHITKQFTDVHDRISHHRDEAASHVMEIVEKRLNSHFSEQMAKMSDVLKKVVTNQRTLQQKMASMESQLEVIGYQVDKKPATRGVTSRATSVSPKRRAFSPQNLGQNRASPTFGTVGLTLNSPGISPSEVDMAFRPLDWGGAATSTGLNATSTDANGNTLVPSTQMPKLEQIPPNSFEKGASSSAAGGMFFAGLNNPMNLATGTSMPSGSSPGGASGGSGMGNVSRQDILNFDLPVTVPGVGKLAGRGGGLGGTAPGNLRSRAGSGGSDRRSAASPANRGAVGKRGSMVGAKGGRGVQLGGNGKLSNKIHRRQAMEDLYRELRRLQSEDMMDDS